MAGTIRQSVNRYVTKLEESCRHKRWHGGLSGYLRYEYNGTMMLRLMAIIITWGHSVSVRYCNSKEQMFQVGPVRVQMRKLMTN